MQQFLSTSTRTETTLSGPLSRPPSKLRVRRVQPSYLTAADVERWHRLSVHSLEPNPFLSPNFVLPLLQHLPPSLQVQMLIVEEMTTGEWCAAGVFEITSPRLRQPLAYAQGLSSSYAFLDGFLVDRRQGAATVEAMLNDQLNHRCWHGFQLAAVRTSSLLDRLLHSTAEQLGMNIFADHQWSRAQFITHPSRSVEEILQHCSKSRRKSLRRGRRLLESYGEVTYALHHAVSGDDDCVDGFLRLEAKGWKGIEGSAIACDPSHEGFFRAMVQRFAEHGDIIFGELRLDGRLISSTCNIRSGEMLSAFKIGWEPEFADAGVGMWSEIELAAAISRDVPEIRHIDSSAKGGSYVESVWPDRQPMHSTTYSWSRRGRALQSARHYYRWVKNLMPQALAAE